MSFSGDIIWFQWRVRRWCLLELGQKSDKCSPHTGTCTSYTVPPQPRTTHRYKPHTLTYPTHSHTPHWLAHHNHRHTLRLTHHTYSDSDITHTHTIHIRILTRHTRTLTHHTYMCESCHWLTHHNHRLSHHTHNHTPHTHHTHTNTQIHTKHLWAICTRVYHSFSTFGTAYNELLMGKAYFYSVYTQT